jgi:hypothetical protein
VSNGFLLRSLPFTASEFQPMAAGAGAVNLQNDFIGMVARSSAANQVWQARLDLGTASPPAIDTVAAVNVFAGSSLTAWSAQGSNDATFAAIGYNSGSLALPADELGNGASRRNLMHLIPSAQTFRYWLITISAAAGVQTEVARALVGTRVQPGRNFGFGVSRGVEDLGDVEFAPGGAMLRRRARKLRTLGLSWGFVTQAEAEAASLPFLELVGSTEFVLASLDPDPHPQRSRRVYYGPLQGNPDLIWRAQNVFEKRLQLRSVI